MRKYLLFGLSILLVFWGTVRATSGNINISSGKNIKIGTSSSGTIISGDHAETSQFHINFIPDQSFWLAFMTILSTIFAVFFVYSGFKIDGTVTKVEEAEKRVLKLEREAREDMEYSNQLRYAIHYMMSKQYGKAIDALVVLRAEPSTLKDSYKLNSCYYFLAICYYEEGLINNDIEDVAKAVEFINEAIEDITHPLKNEIINRFNEMNKAEGDQ